MDHTEVKETQDTRINQKPEFAAMPVQAHSVHPDQRPGSSGANDLHNSDDAMVPNGEAVKPHKSSQKQADPPPLDQAWRKGPSNKSLGLLLQRTAQQCFVDLNETLEKMQATAVESHSVQPNGVQQASSLDTAESSLKKKRLLMDFANTQRERFIKTLVLSNWARAEEEQSRLIDIKVWQDAQLTAHQDAAAAIWQTKMNMIPAKMPQPNIAGAMEVLSTGKASSMPDLGYIPPKRLTAKQLLRTLQDLNVALATRLTLHEDIPPYFQNFSVANGRVTFSVADEFEVDLAVADEDPATPFYFIDLRFLFSPTDGALSDRIRGHLEPIVNKKLAATGLQGCYDCLHNFVLTHKINVLRSQIDDLIRGKWFDCIRLDNLRRNIAVQYWCGMPGPKSWLEIGVSTGKQEIPVFAKPPTPQIAVRWFRRGIEVKGESIEIDLQHVSLEKCLLAVVEKHRTWMLNDLRTKLQREAKADDALDSSFNHDPSDHTVLRLNIRSIQEPLRVSVGPVTGRFSISPPSTLTAYAENHINSDATGDATPRLALALRACVQERVIQEAERLDWTIISDLVPQRDIYTLFKSGKRPFSVFRPRAAWGDAWALAVTFSLAGEKWFAVSLEKKYDGQGNVLGRIINAVHPVRVDAVGGPGVTRTALVRVAKAAVAEVAFGALLKELQGLRVQHRLEKPPSTVLNDLADASQTPVPLSVVYFRFSSLMGGTHDKSRRAWAGEAVRLAHHGFMNDRDTHSGGVGRIHNELRLSLKPGGLAQLRQHVTRFREQDLHINSNGGLALRLLVPFGAPFVEHIRRRLDALVRLDGYLDVLQQRGGPSIRRCLT